MAVVDDIAAPRRRPGRDLPGSLGGPEALAMAHPRWRHVPAFLLVAGLLWVLPILMTALLATDSASEGRRSVLLVLVVLLATHSTAALALICCPAPASVERWFLPLVDRVHTTRVQTRLRRDEATLHQARSMVAGISLAMEVLDGSARGSVPQVTRASLQDMQRSEIHRLARLLGDPSAEVTGPVAVDLDPVLEPLVVAVRARGTRVWWPRSALVALGRPDEIAEVVQVLLENAERHAPGSTVTLEVTTSDDGVDVRVSDAGPGVAFDDPDRVFDWGVRGTGSPGQGIGLSAARELARSLGAAWPASRSRRGARPSCCGCVPPPAWPPGAPGSGPDPAPRRRPRRRPRRPSASPAPGPRPPRPPRRRAAGGKRPGGACAGLTWVGDGLAQGPSLRGVTDPPRLGVDVLRGGPMGRAGGLRVRLLGEFEVTRPDATIVDNLEWRTGKTMDLLRLLALEEGRAVRTESLIERLWPTVSESRGRGSLRTAASQIRRTVGSNCVRRRPDGMVLVDAWVDVSEFLAATRLGHDAFVRGDPAAVLRVARRAESLHRGDFRAYDDDSLWAHDQRHRLATARRDLLCEAAESALGSGLFREALAVAARAAAIDPTSEHAHRLLMRAHAELGEVGSALRVFERYRNHLARELGVDPSRQTRELHLRLLREDL